MELRVLRYFLTVAREGSITAAAAKLHLTQSTLSRRLKDLEGELGLRLFDRKGASMRLTADGLRLCARAEEIVDMLNKTEAEFAVQDAPVAGDLRIGLREGQASLLACSILASLWAEHPEVHVHLITCPDEELCELLDKGHADCALLAEPCPAQFQSLHLPVAEIWGITISMTHPLAAKEHVTVQDLAGRPLLLPCQPEPQARLWQALLAWAGRESGRLIPAGSFNIVPCCAMLAEKGPALLVAPRDLVPQGIVEDKTLCFRPLEPELVTSVCLAWKKDATLPRACELFVRRLETVCEDRR